MPENDNDTNNDNNNGGTGYERFLVKGRCDYPREGSFVTALELTHRLRVCNADPYAVTLDLYVAGAGR